MTNFDDIIMQYKLKLRAVSKPGDDLWEKTEELSCKHICISSSKDDTYYFELILGTYQHKPLMKTLVAFDDHGEWEFKEMT